MSSGQSRPRPDVWRTLLLIGGAAGAVFALSGCDIGHLQVTTGAQGSDPSQAKIAVTPAPKATGAVSPSVPIVVSVLAGRLTTVTLTGPNGPVIGVLSPDSLTWTTPAGALDYGSKYKVSVAAVDRLGSPTTTEQVLSTVAPSKFLGVTINPSAGSVIGVGMPVNVRFDRAVKADAAKRAVEKRLAVTVNGGSVTGAWRWVGDDRVEYRPEVYWPGNATIVISAPLKGIRISKGVWGSNDTSVSFTTAPAMVSLVDMNTHKLTVTQDGKTIRVIPITTGKAGFETRSGTKLIILKERSRIMDASTGGTNKNDPEYYRLEVQYAMRLTWSGEFLHAAPWSVAHQGRDNVSHGCTGMSMSNAAWLYGLSHVGDVVRYVGNNRKVESGNGITVWDMTFAQWKAGSALTS